MQRGQCRIHADGQAFDQALAFAIFGHKTDAQADGVGRRANGDRLALEDDLSSPLVRALDPGGMIWESSDQSTDVDVALQPLDAYLAGWFEEIED